MAIDTDLPYGPQPLLRAFLYKADAALRRRGVTLHPASLAELIELNRRHRDTWSPLVPLFDPHAGGVTTETGFALFGRNAAGEIVAAQGARCYDWTASTLAAEFASLRMYYADPARSARRGERVRISAPSAAAIRGRVVFSGAGWYRPDFRGRLLSAILPRISRALAYARWRSDCTIAMITDPVLKGGMARKAGYTRIEPSFELFNTRVGDYVRGALVWMPPRQLFDDLQRFVTEFDA